jgi:hypothetical protein
MGGAGNLLKCKRLATMPTYFLPEAVVSTL